jgi:hypothetical protein
MESRVSRRFGFLAESSMPKAENIDKEKFLLARGLEL